MTSQQQQQPVRRATSSSSASGLELITSVFELLLCFFSDAENYPIRDM